MTWQIIIRLTKSQTSLAIIYLKIQKVQSIDSIETMCGCVCLHMCTRVYDYRIEKYKKKNNYPQNYNK